MKGPCRNARALLLLTSLALHAGGLPLAAKEPKLPRLAGREALAAVNGRPVTLDEVLGQVADSHAGKAGPQGTLSKEDLAGILDRLIDIRAIVQEGESIGLAELPEVANSMQGFRNEAMRQLLLESKARVDGSPDPALVASLYQQMAREYRVDLAVVDREEDACALVLEARSGVPFSDLVFHAVSQGRAESGPPAGFVRSTTLPEPIREVVPGLLPGAVSEPVPVGGAFLVVKLLETRLGEDPAARSEARKQALQQKRQKALRSFSLAVIERYARVDRDLLASLDFEQPGPEALRADQRVVATVKGGEPVTVGDLAQSLEQAFFHGSKRAVEKQRVNRRKDTALDSLLLDRVGLLEAKRLKIDQTEEFKDIVAYRQDRLVFNVFVRKVVAPEVKVSDAEVARYREEHLDRFTSPEMMRIEGLAFARRERAAEELAKLKAGADPRWMKENADGQVEPEGDLRVLTLGGGPLMTSTFPEGLRKVLAGASSGDVRFYAEGDGPFFVLVVREVIPSRADPLDSVKEKIQRAIVVEKTAAGVAEWGAKLRASGDVKVFVTPEELEQLVRREMTPTR